MEAQTHEQLSQSDTIRSQVNEKNEAKKIQRG